MSTQGASSKNESFRSGYSTRGSRGGSANSRDSWISLKKTNHTFKSHSNDKTLKNIDKLHEAEMAFIQQLEQKPHERDVCKRQAAELLNKRWNDEVYIPTQTSIQKTMDRNSDRYSEKLQEQYAHYLNHNNVSEGNVFLDIFDERRGGGEEAQAQHAPVEHSHYLYQPLQCKQIQTDILKPERCEIKDPLKVQYKSRFAKTLDKSASEYSVGQHRNTTQFWSKLVKESGHIENAENARRRKRIKISDINRQSQIHWGSSA